MDLGYFAADTLGVTLYQIQSRLVANEVHPIHLGPWNVEMTVDVESDILTGTELSFWVTLAKAVRMYVVIRDKENWLFILNSATLRKCGAKNGFEGSTIKARILEIKPAIVAAFHWDGKEWEQHDRSGG